MSRPGKKRNITSQLLDFPLQLPHERTFPFRVGAMEGKFTVLFSGGPMDPADFSGSCQLPWCASGNPGGDPYARINIVVPGEAPIPSEEVAAGGKAMFIKVLMHEIMELACIYLSRSNPHVVMVPAFQATEYHGARRTFVLDHQSSFSDVCDLSAQMWQDLIPAVLSILICISPEIKSWADLDPAKYYDAGHKERRKES